MKKILVIEDDSSMLNSIEDILLINDEYNVIKVANGKEAIDKISTINPDLVLSDIMLPDFNGYEILEQTKNISSGNSIPFIFLSAKAELSDIRKGMSLGADDYLTKPFKAKDLLEAVDVRLKKNQNSKIISKSVEAKSNNHNNKAKSNDWILIKEKEEVRFVKIPEISVIKAMNDYSEVILKGKKYVVKRSLKSWEKILSSNTFIRIHRSTIINLNFVEKFEKTSNSTFLLKINDIDENFTVSRRYSAKLKSQMII